MDDAKRVLVVDDNADMCDMLSDILELEGYAVSVAHDGFQALAAAETQCFDVVLMDIKMPEMNGVETFKRFKKIAPRTPVIMITAFAFEDLIKEALREGAFAALNKPLNFDELFSIIEDARDTNAMILMIDDEQALCSAMKDVLIQQNFRVRVAHDGESALEYARLNNFDVILLDLNLPAMSGYETFLKIKEIRPAATVIIITGFARQLEDVIEKTIEQSAFVCLQKPLNFDKFLPLLDTVIANRNAGRGPGEKPVREAE